MFRPTLSPIYPYQQTPQLSGLGFAGTDFAMTAMQQMLNQSMAMLTTAMTNLMAQMMGNQMGLTAGGGFGPGASGGVSPLNGFLGGSGVGASGIPAPKGQRIKGGKSLYSKGRGMFHKGAPGAPNTYAFENSPAGIKFAAQNGYASIDLDMQITKDGVPVATHWSKPLDKDGFYDPKGKIKKGTKVSQMTLAEVMRLRNKDGQSRIYPVSEMVKHLKKHGIAGDFEAKDDPRFATDKVMGYLANVVRASGIKANLKSIYRGPRSGKILRKAQQHGFWARVALAKKGQKKNWGYG